MFTPYLITAPSCSNAGAKATARDDHNQTTLLSFPIASLSITGLHCLSRFEETESMQLRSGVLLISDLDQLKSGAYYAEMTGYSRECLARHADALSGYGRLGGLGPGEVWSGRWQYPVAVQ